MTYPKPDGSIEIEFSGCCCPPGPRRSGQHTNSGTTWWRVNNEPWRPVLWLGHVRTLAGAAETTQEFLEAMA